MKTENQTVTAEATRGIAAEITAIFKKMLGLASLTEEQKAQRPRVPVSATDLSIFRKRFASAQQSREKIPATFDLATLELEGGRFLALIELMGVLNQFSEGVKDTLWLMSGSVLPSAATASAYIQIALKEGQKMQGKEPRRRRRAPKALASPVQAQPVTVVPPVDPAKQAA